MNENLENQLAEVIKLAKDSSINAADFVQKQFPDFARELLNYHYFAYMTDFVISILCFLGLIICMSKVFKTFKDAQENQKLHEQYDWSEQLCSKFIICIILSIVFFIFGCIKFNYKWAKIQIAPKVYITEYIKDRLIH